MSDTTHWLIIGQTVNKVYRGQAARLIRWVPSDHYLVETVQSGTELLLRQSEFEIII